MAKKGMTQGMPIDLSLLPPDCNHCALGKQTHSTIPKIREGPKADRHLGRVYADLCGPMPVASHTGCVYAMNIIDDFSGYVWSIPLRSKADACTAFQTWHKAVTVQTGDTLRIIVTNNGELVSNAMKQYCDLHGIDHLKTAPYTSAHNGRVERLHRTLAGKARSMRLSCNAPEFLWDEFFATAAYLTNLTAATANNGHTPYELWFSRKPSLSHLREIGCRAFSLQTPSLPKLYPRSVPCILIGYAPHSKAYRLWNPTTSRVFNSFHVTFTEHLNAEPSPLLPGTTLGTEHASAPPSWESHGIIPQSVPSIDTAPSLPSHHDVHVPHPDSVHPLSATIPLSSLQSNHTSSPSISHTSNTSPVSNNTNSPAIRTTNPSSNANNNNTQTGSASRIPRLTIRIPPRPPHIPPRRSHRLQNNARVDYTAAFLSEYADVRDTHDLIPADIYLEGLTSVDEVLAALSDGSIQPTIDIDDEPSWAEAMASDEREYWIAGGREELKSLEDLKVFVLVPRSEVPKHQCPLKGKLVCKRKRDESGRITRYKVRYVAKGFAQRYGVDFDKTTAPTVRLESFRALLHLASSLNWGLKQFDIKTAFLHGVLPEEETMFLEQPPGFEAPGKEEWVMRLMKSIYGMRQASRVWNQTFHKAVSEWGFERLQCEWCVYRRNSPTGTTIFVVHVDDIISAASSPEENERFRDFLKTKWEISELGEPKYALGIAISRNLDNHSVSLSQTSKIDQIVEEFGQKDARPVDTPMVTGLQLRRPDKNERTPPEITEWIERTPYRSLVGSLMYISVATRPDISFAVGRLSSFLDCYRLEHWNAALRVVRYLKGTRSHSLVLGGKNAITLTGFSDSDYANCVDTSRSIGGYCFSLGSGAISWSSKKQPTVADSSCYAEYIALHDAGHEVVFLRQLLDSLQLLPPGPTRLHCDNDAATRLSEDHVWHSHTKHIRVKYHSIRELVLSGETLVTRVGSKDNTADILTKSLASLDFQRLRHSLGVRSIIEDTQVG